MVGNLLPLPPPAGHNVNEHTIKYRITLFHRHALESTGHAVELKNTNASSTFPRPPHSTVTTSITTLLLEYHTIPGPSEMPVCTSKKKKCFNTGHVVKLKIATALAPPPSRPDACPHLSRLRYPISTTRCMRSSNDSTRNRNGPTERAGV